MNNKNNNNQIEEIKEEACKDNQNQINNLPNNSLKTFSSIQVELTQQDPLRVRTNTFVPRRTRSSSFFNIQIERKESFKYEKILTELKKFNPSFLSFSPKISPSNKNQMHKITNIESRNIKDLFMKRVLSCLEKESEKRTFDDLGLIIKYLSNTHFVKYYLKENLLKEVIEQILVFCSSGFKAVKYPDKHIVFRIGDLPDFFYLVFTGEVLILKPSLISKNFTGSEYFHHLMELKRKKEYYLYNHTIRLNNQEFPINANDIKYIHLIYAKQILHSIYTGTYCKFENVLEYCNITPNELGLDPLKINDIPYLVANKERINDIILPFSSDKLIQYYFFHDNNLKKNVRLYEYKKILTMGPGMHFGDTALDSNAVRNATIQTKGDTILLYLDAYSYVHNLKRKKQEIITKEVGFLHHNFFFCDINVKKFEKIYYSYFLIEDLKKGDILCKENTPINFIYFIRKGSVRLYSMKSSLEIHLLLEKIKKQNSQLGKDFLYSFIKSNVIDLNKELTLPKMNKIVILNNCETIGLESIYYELPYIVTAEIESDEARIVKIDIERLRTIINKEPQCLSKMKIFSDEKMSVLFERFFNINNTNIITADEKHYYRNRGMFTNKKREKDGQSSGKLTTMKEDSNNKDMKFPSVLSKRNLIKHNKYYKNIENMIMSQIEEKYGRKKPKKRSESMANIFYNGSSKENKPSNFSIEDKILFRLKKELELYRKKNKNTTLLNFYNESLTNREVNAKRKADMGNTELNKKQLETFSLITQFTIKNQTMKIPNFSNQLNRNEEKKGIISIYADSVKTQRIKKFSLNETRVIGKTHSYSTGRIERNQIDKKNYSTFRSNGNFNEPYSSIPRYVQYAFKQRMRRTHIQKEKSKVYNEYKKKLGDKLKLIIKDS